MSAIQIVAVACLFAIGTQALTTTHNYHHNIGLKDDDFNRCFVALDVHGTDKQISEEDLIHHYYHHKVAHNKKRFLEWIDSSSDLDKTVNPDELKTFMKKPMVTLAVHVCSFIRSPSLKSMCHGDKLLAYIALVMDFKTVNTLFTTIEKADDKDEEIDMAEMQDYLTKINAGTELDICDADVKNMMIEIGGDNEKISVTEWKEYLIQEELHDNFRICRTNLVQETCEVEYGPECVVTNLMRWTMKHYTERDIEETFHVFDTNTNGFIEADEIKNGFKDADETLISKVITMMDKADPADGKISYAEFRLYNRDHWVQIEMERDCSSKKKAQADQIVCYVEKLKELVIENHRAVWLKVPDLDMLITFEHLDHNGNGRIEKETDLIEEWKWDANAATNLIAEMDGPDKDVHVSLEEFNEAVDEPHLMYATADCMDYVLQERPKRTECYNGELQGLLKNILSKDQVRKLFDHYDTNRCGRITLDEIKAKVNGDDDDADNIMTEIGMGDKTINLREFSWYVKQQRMTTMFIDEKCGTEASDRHVVVKKYVDNVFTELETQMVFRELDTDKNWELSDKDCAGHDPLKHKNLLERMDKPDDPDNTVNFSEFWLFMNTPMGPEPRKTKLEKECTITNKKQADEMKCYFDHIWDVK